MKRKKEKLLADFKRSGESCLCRRILEYKLYRLQCHYDALKIKLEKIKSSGNGYPQTLGALQKVCNQRAVIANVLKEIKDAEQSAENMFEVNVNGTTLLRATENSHRKRSCGKKIKYLKSDAETALEEVQAKTTSKLEVYECGYCEYWHI